MNCDQQTDEIVSVAQDLYRAFFRIEYAGIVYAVSMFISKHGTQMFGGALRPKNIPNSAKEMTYGPWVDLLPPEVIPPSFMNCLMSKLHQLSSKTDWNQI